MKQENKTAQRQKNERKPDVSIDDLLKNINTEHHYQSLAKTDYAAGEDPLRPLYGAFAASLYGIVDRLKPMEGEIGYEGQFLKMMADHYAGRAGYGIPGQEKDPAKNYGRGAPKPSYSGGRAGRNYAR